VLWLYVGQQYMMVVSSRRENAVYDMYLWYIFLDDVDHLVEEFYTYSIK
jgi:hypothetical protein